MSTFAIGDIQGCFTSLIKLLEHINFQQDKDELWIAGDLVNRGPQSLEVLRYIKSLKNRVKVVLGNHDLHLLAVAKGCQSSKKFDTFSDVLEAPDKDELLAWLLTKPMLHYDEKLDCAMVHAGIYPGWDLQHAKDYAEEAETMLTAEPKMFFQNMYGNKPAAWSDDLSRWDRIRFITNTLTRMRYCQKTPNPVLDFANKNKPNTEDRYLTPWLYHDCFKIRQTHIVFGHWSTFGESKMKNITALDTGCLWGGSLTALNIETKQIFAVTCK